MSVRPTAATGIDLRYLCMESLAALIAMVADFNMAMTGSMLVRGDTGENAFRAE